MEEGTHAIDDGVPSPTPEPEALNRQMATAQPSNPSTAQGARARAALPSTVRLPRIASITTCTPSSPRALPFRLRYRTVVGGRRGWAYQVATLRDKKKREK